MITNNVDEAILLSDRIVPMTPGPPATLGRRSGRAPAAAHVAQLAHDEQATHVRAHVVGTLTAALGASDDARRPGAKRAGPPRSLPSRARRRR